MIGYYSVLNIVLYRRTSRPPSTRCQKYPPATCDNQKCLQLLPKVPLGTKIIPNLDSPP